MKKKNAPIKEPKRRTPAIKEPDTKKKIEKEAPEVGEEASP